MRHTFLCSSIVDPMSKAQSAHFLARMAMNVHWGMSVMQRRNVAIHFSAAILLTWPTVPAYMPALMAATTHVLLK